MPLTLSAMSDSVACPASRVQPDPSEEASVEPPTAVPSAVSPTPTPTPASKAGSRSGPTGGGQRSLRLALDWTALQKALVFTKLVYRKPQVEKLKKPLRPPLPSAEAITAVAAASIRAAAGGETAGAGGDAGSTRFVDAFGETDERLLPWSCD